MTEYDNTNRWTLNKNDKKREGKQDADYNGSINVNGVEYWLNGWIKEGRNGKFISGNIRLKDEQAQQPASQPARRPDPISSGPGIRKNDMDDDIPFAPEWRG